MGARRRCPGRGAREAHGQTDVVDECAGHRCGGGRGGGRRRVRHGALRAERDGVAGNTKSLRRSRPTTRCKQWAQQQTATTPDDSAAKDTVSGPSSAPCSGRPPARRWRHLGQSRGGGRDRRGRAVRRHGRRRQRRPARRPQRAAALRRGVPAVHDAKGNQISGSARATRSTYRTPAAYRAPAVPPPPPPAPAPSSVMTPPPPPPAPSSGITPPPPPPGTPTYSSPPPAIAPAPARPSAKAPAAEPPASAQPEPPAAAPSADAAPAWPQLRDIPPPPPPPANAAGDAGPSPPGRQPSSPSPNGARRERAELAEGRRARKVLHPAVRRQDQPLGRRWRSPARIRAATCSGGLDGGIGEVDQPRMIDLPASSSRTARSSFGWAASIETVLRSSRRAVAGRSTRSASASAPRRRSRSRGGGAVGTPMPSSARLMAGTA